MARREWADTIVANAMDGYQWNARKRKSPVNLPAVAVKLLRKEHQRAVRIVKRLEREAIDRQEPDCTRCYLDGVRDVLAALQKGRA